MAVLVAACVALIGLTALARVAMAPGAAEPPGTAVTADGALASADLALSGGEADAELMAPEPEAVNIRPIAVPLPSAGLGGIVLLMAMAFWRSAALRSTRRLH